MAAKDATTTIETEVVEEVENVVVNADARVAPGAASRSRGATRSTRSSGRRATR